MVTAPCAVFSNRSARVVRGASGVIGDLHAWVAPPHCRSQRKRRIHFNAALTLTPYRAAAWR